MLASLPIGYELISLNIIMEKYVLNCHLKNETDKFYKKTTVCVVLANCAIFLLTFKRSIRSKLLWRYALIFTFGDILYEKNNGWRQSNVLNIM